MRPCRETRYGCRGFRAGGLTRRKTRAAVPHSDNVGSTLGDAVEFVIGIAATIGSASDSSMSESNISPISFETGMVKRDAGSRMSGCGSARTGNLEVAMRDDGEGQNWLEMKRTKQSEVGVR